MQAPSKRFVLPGPLYQNDVCPIVVECYNTDGTAWNFQSVEYQVNDSAGNVVIADSTGEVSLNVASIPIDGTVTATPDTYELIVRFIRDTDPDTGLPIYPPIVFNRSGELIVLEL